MKIFAKGSLTDWQLSVKQEIGCDGLEVQLLNELVEDRIRGKYRAARDVFDLDSLAKYNVTVVHAPLLQSVGDVTLESLVDARDIWLLDQIFYIANFFGKRYDRKCIIVLHSESFYDILHGIGNVWNDILQTLDIMLDRYQNVEVVIENVSPLRGIGKGKVLHLANNFMFDNVEMVMQLRDSLKTDAIGTCLDTCHAMLAEKYINILYAATGEYACPDLSMIAYFEQNAPVLKLIHLCDIAGSGYGKGRHGIAFKEHRYDVLDSIIALHQKYVPEVPLTLEVEEDDYSVCDNYHGLYNLLRTRYV